MKTGTQSKPPRTLHSIRASSTRREFLSSLARSGAAASVLVGAPWITQAYSSSASGGVSRKRIALLATEVRKYSHAQHFIDRFLEGYGWQGHHHRPRVDLVSLYVDQFPEGDLSRDRAERHGVKIYPTIAEALTLGGSELAVDGVVIIAEHGKYPNNEKGQKLYPRYKFFKEVVAVFESSGRGVPVFNDKHLSTEWDECVEMVEDARRLQFPFLAGSSLPVTWRLPSIDMPLDTPLEESLCACYGGVDSYDFHGFETAQCMSERRAGAETGVRSVHAVKGANLWQTLAQRRGTQELLLSALSRSFTLKAPAGYTCWVPSIDWIQKTCPDAVGWFLEHNDGFQTTMFTLNGLISDFNYAGRKKDSGEIVSCQMHLPMPPRYTTLADFFNPLTHHIEQTILTGRASYPVERALLTSGMTLFGVESLFRGEQKIMTPKMNVTYRVEEPSTYWRT